MSRTDLERPAKKSKELVEKLFDALRSGSEPRVRALLARGARLGEDARSSQCAMELAAEGSAGKIAALAESGFRFDRCVGRDGWTPLHMAARHAGDAGDGGATVALLARLAGSDVDARDSWGMTPLAVAAAHRQIDAARALVRAEADPRARDAEGAPPLTQAFRYQGNATAPGELEMIQLLLRAGARADESAPLSPSPLEMAARCDDPRLLDAMLASAAPHGRPADEALAGHLDSALACAAADGMVESVLRLLASGADSKAWVPLRSGRGSVNALGAACESERPGGPECAAALILAGADVDEVGPRGLTALMSAVSLGRLEAVELLLGLGADPDKGVGAATPAMLAVRGRAGAARARLMILALGEAGADFEARAEPEGVDLLEDAILRGAGEMARAIREAGPAWMREEPWARAADELCEGGPERSGREAVAAWRALMEARALRGQIGPGASSSAPPRL